MLLAVLKRVFQEPSYILLVGVVASAYLLFFLKFAINPTNFSLAYIIAIAVLIGINISLITYYIRVEKREFNNAGTRASLFGIVSGTLGVGCAACGSIILSSIIGTAAGASLIGFLPLKGDEFRIIGIVLLVTSTYFLAKQITKPAVC